MQNLTKIRKEAKHIPCVDVGLQRRILHFATVTNPNTNDEDEEAAEAEEDAAEDTDSDDDDDSEATP